MSVFRKSYITIFLFVLSNIYITDCFSQSGSISGRVSDQKGGAVEYASIVVNRNKGVITDSLGYFSFNDLDKGTYHLEAQHLGHKSQQKTVDVSNDVNTVDFVLIEDLSTLDEVVVRSLVETEERKVKKTGYKVDIVKADIYKAQPFSLTDVIRKTPGILVRESGGMGSSFELYVNGLSGNKIRYFLDGIPMENFGSSLTLNNFPVNLIKKMEVYKGVVPVELGSDALGGAINISTVDLKKSFLNGSISVGSFGTKRASLNGQYVSEKGIFATASGFYNHSDNNYRMDDVNVYELDLGNFQETISTRRFHDSYRSYMFNGKVGVKGKKYADMLYVAYTGSKNKKEYQHPETNVETVYGDFHSKGETNLFSLHYKKKWKKLDLKGNVLKGKVKRTIVDTSSVRYNWAEEAFLRSSDSPEGEVYNRKRIFIITDDIIRSTITSSYHINKKNSINLGFVQNYLKREGTDRVDEFNNTFQTPNYVNKIYGGISYDHKSLNDKLRASVFVKRFVYNAKIEIQEQQNGRLSLAEPKINKTGYGGTLSYKVAKNTFLKTSFEKAYRLPNDYEILGDGAFITYNPDLESENSNNINFGALYTTRFRDMRLKAEANLFLRFSENFIQLGAVGGPYSRYDNINNVRSQGVEASLNFKINPHFSVDLNGTYQRIIERTKTVNGLPNENYNNEVPNIPYLFANSRLTVHPFDTQKKNKLSIYFDSRYVKDFFLSWKGLGDVDTKNVIPTQFVNDLTLAYSMKNDTYNVSLSCMNIFDIEAYDNFRIQKPGRSFFVKLIFNVLN